MTAKEIITRWLIDDMSIDDNEHIPTIAQEFIETLSAAGYVIVDAELLKQAQACALVASIDAPLQHQRDAFMTMAAKFEGAAALHPAKEEQ